MIGIEPRTDVYGTYGRACALADWLELAAIAGQRHTSASLSDLIDDNGWSSKPTRHFITDDDYYDDSDNNDPEDLASLTFSMLRTRNVVLGTDYPFEESSGALRYSGGSYSPYLSILSIAVAHSWPEIKLDQISPEHIFEKLVATALADHGLRVVAMGALDREKKGFAANLVAGGTRVGLKPTPRPLNVAVYAKDEGVDTLAALPWRDGRQGHIVLIGQATCGKSDTWENKLDEPKPARWGGWLLEPVDPLSFLAVPHHVDPPHFETLVSARRGLVIDRLRLATHSLGVNKEERQIVDAVLDAGVNDGRSAQSRRFT